MRIKTKRQLAVAAYIALPLLLTTACLVRIDTVCRQQVDTLDQIVELRQEVDKLETVDISTEATISNLETVGAVSLGEFKITHYCPCEQCCGKTDGITYTGTQATAGRTIGVDPDVIPLGSTVYIDGQVYIAEDIGGGIKGKRIDMFVEEHQEALQLGVKRCEVFQVKEKVLTEAATSDVSTHENNQV